MAKKPIVFLGVNHKCHGQVTWYISHKMYIYGVYTYGLWMLMVIPPLYKLWILLLALVLLTMKMIVWPSPNIFHPTFFPMAAHGTSLCQGRLGEPLWFPLQHQVLEHGTDWTSKFMLISCSWYESFCAKSGVHHFQTMFLAFVSFRESRPLAHIPQSSPSEFIPKSQFWQIPNWKWCFGWDVSTIKHHDPWSYHLPS